MFALASGLLAVSALTSYSRQGRRACEGDRNHVRPAGKTETRDHVEDDHESGIRAFVNELLEDDGNDHPSDKVCRAYAQMPRT